MQAAACRALAGSIGQPDAQHTILAAASVSDAFFRYEGINFIEQPPVIVCSQCIEVLAGNGYFIDPASA
jgi:hypothetical protein